MQVAISYHFCANNNDDGYNILALCFVFFIFFYKIKRTVPWIGSVIFFSPKFVEGWYNRIQTFILYSYIYEILKF